MLGHHASSIAYVSLVLWALAALSFSPSAWRYIRGPYNLVDSYRTAIFFMALLWVGGLGRLVFMPDAENVRLAVLAFSCVVAVYLLILARQGSLR
jgi:hypothetical protein